MADELVRLRVDRALSLMPPRARGKVTARYWVDLGAGEPVPCVRVRLHGRSTTAVVLHFSEARFAELFEAIESSDWFGAERARETA